MRSPYQPLRFRDSCPDPYLFQTILTWTSGGFDGVDLIGWGRGKNRDNDDERPLDDEGYSQEERTHFLAEHDLECIDKQKNAKQKFSHCGNNDVGCVLIEVFLLVVDSVGVSV